MTGRPWIASVALGLGGCGWYTNFPAAIDVINVDPSTVAVEYATSAATSGTAKVVTAKYTNPTITLAGKPGSIGATFKTLEIYYYSAGVGGKGPVIETLNAEKKSLFLGTLVRVDGSTMREDYEKGYQEMGPDFSSKRLIIGQSKFVAPVVTTGVLRLAEPGASSPPNMIWAHIILGGEDDAKWPTSKEVMVPITFAETVK